MVVVVAGSPGLVSVGTSSRPVVIVLFDAIRPSVLIMGVGDINDRHKDELSELLLALVLKSLPVHCYHLSCFHLQARTIRLHSSYKSGWLILPLGTCREQRHCQ